MRKALTAAAVERMRPPPSGQIEVFDRGYPGLLLRVSYGGGKAFAMFYRHGGKLRRLTLGWHPAMTLAEAREAWREARRLVAMGQDPGHAPVRKGDTFTAVVSEWIKRDKRDAKPSTIYQIEAALRRDVLTLWGSREVGSISKREIHELLDGIVDRAPGTARAVHSHLRSLFRWAAGREIISINPMVGVEPPTTVKARDRVLSDAELVKIWRAADADDYGPLIKLLILTGARREEVTQLRWSEVVDDAIHLGTERTKTGEPRTIPLSPQALAILAGVPRNGALVFGNKRAWPRAKARIDAAARINQPWVVHDLRRSCATGLQRLGVQLQVVEAILGHVGTRAGIVGVYQRHDFLEEKRAALEAWGKHVGGLI